MQDEERVGMPIKSNLVDDGEIAGELKQPYVIGTVGPLHVVSTDRHGLVL